MPRYKGCQKSEDDMGENLRSLHIGTRAFLHEQVDAFLAIVSDGECGVIHRNTHGRIHSAAHGRNMDEPHVPPQPHGRCVQHGQRKFHAGDSPHGERIFGKPAYQVCVSGTGVGRMDKRGKSFPRLDSPRYARFRQELCGGEQLYQTADFQRVRVIPV